MKNVLVLGAGLVSHPLVNYLASQSDFFITVASRTVSKAEKLIKGFKNAKAIALNVQNTKQLEELVSSNDLSISLLPYVYHVKVAKLCIKHKKPMVTASYVSEEMKKLDKEAKKAGVLILNEIGLDPGIDHISAMKIIDQVKAKNGKIIGFKSFCGGLPAPESDDNPFHYKFSWSPKGTVLAVKNNALYLKDNKTIEVPWNNLFKSPLHRTFDGVGDTEIYPNRNSLPYIELYDLKDVKTMFRGTIRYPEHCDLWLAIEALELVNNEKINFKGATYADMIKELSKANSKQSIQDTVFQNKGYKISDKAMEKLTWLGIFNNDPLPQNPIAPIDALVAKMEQKLQYKDGEKDMVILRHEFSAIYPNGKKEEIISTMIDKGIVGKETSMAKTVGMPAAIAAAMILKNKIIGVTGVHIPNIAPIYEPVLEELGNYNISFKEEINLA